MALQGWLEPNPRAGIINSPEGTYGVKVRAAVDLMDRKYRWAPLETFTTDVRMAAVPMLQWLRDQRIYPIHQYDQRDRIMYLAPITDAETHSKVFWFIRFRTYGEAFAFFLRWG